MNDKPTIPEGQAVAWVDQETFDCLTKNPHGAIAYHRHLAVGAPDPFQGRTIPLYAALSASQTAAPAIPEGQTVGYASSSMAFTDEHVNYINRYGGFCRDCADENGVCPSRGLPCQDSDKAIRFVLNALAYGVNHGYVSRPLAAPIPSDRMREEFEAAMRERGWNDKDLWRSPFSGSYTTTIALAGWLAWQAAATEAAARQCVGGRAETSKPCRSNPTTMKGN